MDLKVPIVKIRQGIELETDDQTAIVKALNPQLLSMGDLGGLQQLISLTPDQLLARANEIGSRLLALDAEALSSPHKIGKFLSLDNQAKSILENFFKILDGVHLV